MTTLEYFTARRATIPTERRHQVRIASALLDDVTGHDFGHRHWETAEMGIEHMRAHLASFPLTQEQSRLWLSNIDVSVRRDVEDLT